MGLILDSILGSILGSIFGFNIGVQYVPVDYITKRQQWAGKESLGSSEIFPTKDDFINQIIEDCDDIGLEWDENSIKNQKKNKFKVIVQNKLRTAAHSYLLEKKDKLSKLDNLSTDYSLKDYLTSHKKTTFL